MFLRVGWLYVRVDYISDCIFFFLILCVHDGLVKELDVIFFVRRGGAFFGAIPFVQGGPDLLLYLIVTVSIIN